MYFRHCIFLYDKYQQSALTMCVEVPKKRLSFAMLVCLALYISPLQLNKLNVSDDRPSRGSSTIQVFVGYHWLPKYLVIDAKYPGPGTQEIHQKNDSKQASELATIGALIVGMAGDDVHSKNRASG
jgi:hypothetical protein